jgi:hypothetical protein
LGAFRRVDVPGASDADVVNDNGPLGHDEAKLLLIPFFKHFDEIGDGRKLPGLVTHDAVVGALVTKVKEVDELHGRRVRETLRKNM